jgi:hypothetical protein
MARKSKSSQSNQQSRPHPSQAPSTNPPASKPEPPWDWFPLYETQTPALIGLHRTKGEILTEKTRYDKSLPSRRVPWDASRPGPAPKRKPGRPRRLDEPTRPTREELEAYVRDNGRHPVEMERHFRDLYGKASRRSLGRLLPPGFLKKVSSPNSD